MANDDAMDGTPVCLSDTMTGTVARSPSILQKNTKLYGPMNVLDYDNETSSWNSEGNHQDCSITIDFKRSVFPKQIMIQFQAGFAAETCTIYDESANEIDEFEPEDTHEVQTIHLESSLNVVRALKLEFSDCTDFYDRVIVYRIEVWGKEHPADESSR